MLSGRTSMAGIRCLFLSLRLLRREIMRVFLMFRPKNMYSIIPTTGKSNSTVTQARDFRGFRFSETTTSMIPMVVSP
jgi:hypothetical protein